MLSDLGMSCDCSSFCRLTLKIMPRAIAVKIVEEPPREMSGRVCPVSGIRFTVTMMCSSAWQVINRANPRTSRPGNAVPHRRKISMARKKIHR